MFPYSEDLIGRHKSTGLVTWMKQGLLKGDTEYYVGQLLETKKGNFPCGRANVASPILLTYSKNVLTFMLQRLVW